MPERLRDRGEVALLEEIGRLVPAGAGVLVGPGDDAAVLRALGHPLLLTTDALVEGVHFRRRWLTARELGWRAFQVAASDVAAMGGRARAVLLAVTAPATLAAAELRAIVRGVRDAAAAVDAALVGGNLASSRKLSLTVSVLGDASRRPVLRSGARPGDRLFVTGSLGGAALGLRLLEGARSMQGGGTAIRRWRRPLARLRAGSRLASGIANAMIDLSDGLLIDTARLCRASGCGAVIRAEHVPLAAPLRTLPVTRARRLALAGGEDYELLVAVPAAKVSRMTRAGLGCSVTAIGEIVRGRGVTVVDADGRRRTGRGRAGHEHFHA